MEKCNHLLKFIKTSYFIYNNIRYDVDRYECQSCERIYTIDRKTGNKVNFNGLIGEEIDDR